MSKKKICQKFSLTGEKFCDFEKLTGFHNNISTCICIVPIWKNLSMWNVFILIRTSINISISIFSLVILMHIQSYFY